MSDWRDGPSVTYAQGHWVAVVGPNEWLLVNADPDDDLVVGVWRKINSEGVAGSIRHLLEGQDRAGGRPAFALVSRELEHTRVVLSGSATVEVETAQSTSRLECPIWSATIEAVIEAPVLKVSISGPEGSDGLVLPVAGGVVPASRIDLDWVAAPPSERASTAPSGSGDALDPNLAMGNRITATGAPAIVSSGEPPFDVGPSAGSRWTDQPEDDIDGDRGSGPGDAQVTDDEGYGHLFGNTVRRSVDDAAVHIHEEEAIQSLPETTVSEETTVPEPSGEDAVAEPPRHETTPSTGLIDAVPWGARRSDEVEGDRSAVSDLVAPVTGSGDAVSVDELEDLGLTVSRTVAATALRELEGQPDAAESGPAVHAVHCAAGHPNPAHADQCRVCGGAIENQAPVTMPRPVLGLLRLSSGGVIALDRGVLIGRSPSEGRLVGGERPHIVKLASPDQDISRNHVEICLDDWHVLVTDLNSMNGTVITRPGRDPERLRPDQPTMIEPGTTIALADDLTVTFEATE